MVSLASKVYIGPIRNTFMMRSH